MAKKRKPVPLPRWLKRRCCWCNVVFNCVQSRTATCSNKCRLRLHRYQKETGLWPEKPPGDITTRAAVDCLILELLQRERVRREQLAAR